MYFAKSNILIVFLFLQNAANFSSVLILRLFLVSWSLCFLIYAHTCLIACPLGVGLEPITSASAGVGCNFIMRAGFIFLAIVFPFVLICDNYNTLIGIF
jgi:hypothetical protein